MIGIGACNQPRERGIPGRRGSTARVDHVPALCTHRPSLLPIERSGEVLGSGRRRRRAAWWLRLLVSPRRSTPGEDDRTRSFRGSKSRNKVSVGEPAEGSLPLPLLLLLLLKTEQLKRNPRETAAANFYRFWLWRHRRRRGIERKRGGWAAGDIIARFFFPPRCCCSVSLALLHSYRARAPPPSLLSLVTPRTLTKTQSKSKTKKKKQNQKQTLDGGSLGSSVDEERGQPRELMRIAGLSEHRHLERTLRLRDPLSRGPVRSRGGKWHVFFLLIANPPPPERGGGASKPSREETSRRPRMAFLDLIFILPSSSTCSFWTVSKKEHERRRRRRRKKKKKKKSAAMENGTSQAHTNRLRLPLTDRGVAPDDRAQRKEPLLARFLVGWR